MINIYYDPILGMKYDYLGELFILDLECIPQDVKFDTEQWMKYFKETRISILDFSPQPCCEIVGQITNYRL